MLEIKKLVPDMWEDYIDFFETRAFTDGNINKGCYCVWHHWTDKREHERSLLPLNEQPMVKKNFAAYDSGVMVGFCNTDKKDSYFRLSQDKTPEIWSEGEDGSKTLSIVCFTVAPEMRGMGVASAMLKVVCEYAIKNGYNQIESYPSRFFQTLVLKVVGYRSSNQGLAYRCGL